MPIDKRWQGLGPEDWVHLARAWLAEMRGSHPASGISVKLPVTAMTFHATGDQQWRFILAAVEHAESDGELEYIAAGPIERLLAQHGPDYIGLVEGRSAADPKFARMMTGAWKYLMADEVWTRVRRLQAQVPDPLGRDREALNHEDREEIARKLDRLATRCERSRETSLTRRDEWLAWADAKRREAEVLPESSTRRSLLEEQAEGISEVSEDCLKRAEREGKRAEECRRKAASYRTRHGLS